MTMPIADTDDGFVEDILDEPSPSPEAPAAEPEAPASVAAQPTEPAKAQPTRDDTGRFSKKRPAIDGPGAQAPEPTASPEPTAPVADVVEGEPAAPDVPEPSPWTFNADKQAYHLDGAYRGDFGNGAKGLYIPDEHVATIQELIAEGIAHRGSWREEKAALQAQVEKPSRETLEKWRGADPEVLRAKAFNTRLLSLMQQGPDAVQAWLSDFERNMPVLMADAEKAVLQAERDELRAAQQAADDDRESAALQPKIESTLRDVIQQLAGRDAFKGVDAAAIHQRVMDDQLDQVVYEVPAAERPNGVNQGEMLIGRSRAGNLFVVNWGKIEREFQYQSQFLTRAATQSSAAATKVAQKVAAAKSPAPAVPPTVPAAGSPSPTAARLPIPKGKKEVQKWIDSGKWKESFPD